MHEQDQILDSFLSGVKIKQRRTAVLFTAVSLASALVGVSLLVYFTHQVKKKLAEVSFLEEKLHETERQLRDTEAALREATNLKKYVVPIDYISVKHIAVNNPGVFDLLHNILTESRDIKWHLNGKSPEEGFDSPGYAAYVLKRAGKGQSVSFSDIGNSSIRQQLLAELPHKPINSPLQSGDLIIYKGGFSMFYFVEESSASSHELRKREFVIGMTPLGVTALEKHFASFEDQDIRRPF